jgi:hypothetical protein
MLHKRKELDKKKVRQHEWHIFISSQHWNSIWIKSNHNATYTLLSNRGNLL